MKLPIEAMLNFTYFCSNYPSNFIEECWKDNPHMMGHLQNKFNEIYDVKAQPREVLRFVFELDEDNREKFLTWIHKNYSHSGKELDTTLDRVTEAWRTRVKGLEYKRGSKKYMDAQVEFFIGALTAVEEDYPLWVFSIMGGRDILTEYDDMKKKKDEATT